MAVQRKIIHVDMDAFFASVEQRDQPKYKGLPVIVGGQPNSRGVVAACSYEARQFGIHSAMPCSRAYRLCPDAIFVPPRFEAYREVSNQIRDIFWLYASEVEPLSLDEAYLDVTYTEAFDRSATLIAQAIKEEILKQTGLTASAGVSYNKFLAKIASDINKPNGLYVIKPEHGAGFVAELAIGQFHGIGPAIEKKMLQLGIRNGYDLYQKSRHELIRHFGKSGSYYYNIARGIDERPVCSQRVRKSYGKETTFAEDIMSLDLLSSILNTLADMILTSLDKQEIESKTLTLKVKYADFQQVTRAYTVEQSLDRALISELIPLLLTRTKAGIKPVRLVGLSCSGLVKKQSNSMTTQLDLDFIQP